MNSPQFQRRTHPARDRLEALPRRWPDAWRLIDDLRKVAAPTWPPYVYLSLPAASAVITEQRRLVGIPRAPGGPIGDQARDAAELAALASWRMTQGIYRFDPAVYEALIGTPLTGDIPCDVLRRLPEWCCYVEASIGLPTNKGTTADTRGAWVWLDQDERDSSDMLLILWDTIEPALSATTVIPLVGSLGDAVARVESEWAAARAAGATSTRPLPGMAAAYASCLPAMLSLVLYLCAEAPDLAAARAGGRHQPGNPEPVRVRRDGWRLFAAERPSVWDVGVRMGAALRRAYQQAETDGLGDAPHAGPRAHIRRAHWHGFWSGPRAGERRFDVRWMPPIPVNLDDVGALSAVVRPVR